MNSPANAPQSSVKPASPDWWLVVRKFFQHGTTIASFAPSSRFLARKILKGIDYDAARCIVELGAGTGPITKALIDRVRPHTRLIVVERDPDFCKRLRERFAYAPHAEIVEGDAAHIDRLLADRGVTQVDHIVSGLPLPSFPAEVRDAILGASARALGEHGTFRQLTYMPLVFWQFYRGYFNNVRFQLVPLNIPPAGVYVCRKYKFDRVAA